MSGQWRSRWAALGACAVVAIGGGGLLTSFAAGESSFVAVTPTRVLDTRIDLGLGGRFTSDVARVLTVTGTIPTASGTIQVVPAGATAVVLNVTIVGPTSAGFASVRPGDAVGAPATSSLNFSSGGATPNAVTVALPPAGNINLYYFGYSGGTTDMLIDVVGYYVAGASGPPGADGADGADGARGVSLGREAVFSRSVTDVVADIGTLVADSGTNPSIAIGVDGLPIIAHTDLTNNDLQVTHCNDLACATTTNTTVDIGDFAGDAVGFDPSIAIGSDGFAVIAHRDGTDAESELRVTHCSNVACTAATSFTVDPNGNVGHDPAIAIGVDGFPIIAYTLITNTSLKVAKCSNLVCTSVTTAIVDEDNTVGVDPAITIGTDGFAIIAHNDLSTNDLRVTHCDNAACTLDTTTSVDTVGEFGGAPSIAIGVDGFAIIAHRVRTAEDLRVTHCSNLTCSTATSTTVATTNSVGSDSSITISPDGLAVIAHYDETGDDLWISRCDNATCTSATSKAVDTANNVGNTPSIAIGSDNHVVIAHRDASGTDLRFTKLIHMAWTINAWES